MRQYYVYIMASQSRVLYVGMTNDLVRRVHQHKTHTPGAFTARYQVDKLVYFEAGSNVHAVIAREKQLKGLTRRRKVKLIEQNNPAWTDLTLGWVPATTEVE